MSEENGNSEHWFVRSATPIQCKGPYHTNLVKATLCHLKSVGYKDMVMGGRRIDFVKNKNASHAHLVGFSYVCDKGDHRKVEAITVSTKTDLIEMGVTL